MAITVKKRVVKPASTDDVVGQFAALAYRITDRGDIEVALTKTRDTGQWGLPKGHPMPGKDGAGVARLEIKQEVGILGDIVNNKKPFGRFLYNKATYANGVKNSETVCWVEVYLLRAKAQLFQWKEKDQRKATWMTMEKAAASLVSNKNILANEAYILSLLLKANGEVMRIESSLQRKLLKQNVPIAGLDIK